MVLTGTGTMFSPGLDLWKLLDGGGPYVEKLLVELSDGLRRLFTLPVPVVAAVNGHAIAGGCIIAAACDHRVMTDVPSARIGIPEFRVGVPFPTVPLEIMRELVPHHHLRSLVLGGATVDPTRAVELRRREVARREVPRGGRCHPFRERRPRREVPDSRNDSRNGWHLGQGRPQPPAEATDAAPSAAFTRFTRLTNQAGLESSPALSPDGELVAYVAFDGDDRDVFLLRVGGQKPINLTEDSPADEQRPAFSPDGRSIAFRSERDGGGLFVMGATGESVRRLTDFGDNPSWSPDGREIVFGTEGRSDPDNREKTSELWIVPARGGEPRKIFAGDSVHPAWSPNGNRIAYWAIESGVGVRDVWTVGADGTDPRRVTDGPSVDWNPVWSADGRFLYFVSDRSGTSHPWRVAIDEPTGEILCEPEPMLLPTSWSGQLSWSSSGGRLAFRTSEQTAQVRRLPFDAAETRITGPAERLFDTTIAAVGLDVTADGLMVFRTLDSPEDV